MPLTCFKAEQRDQLAKFDADGGGKLDAEVCPQSQHAYTCERVPHARPPPCHADDENTWTAGDCQRFQSPAEGHRCV